MRPCSMLSLAQRRPEPSWPPPPPDYDECVVRLSCTLYTRSYCDDCVWRFLSVLRPFDRHKTQLLQIACDNCVCQDERRGDSFKTYFTDDGRESLYVCLATGLRWTKRIYGSTHGIAILRAHDGIRSRNGLIARICDQRPANTFGGNVLMEGVDVFIAM